MSYLAQRVHAIKPSATIAVSMKAQEMRDAGRDVISLGAGEPDFDTPDHIKAAAQKALEQGQTKYTAVDGVLPLRQAISKKFKTENNLDYTPSQILVSTGAKHSIFNLMMAVLDDGDEVIIPAPYWVSYPDMAMLFGGVPKIIRTTIDQGLKISPGQLEEAISEKTKLLILNSPSNPTGVAYSSAELKELGEVLAKHPHVLIVTDDIYEHILWSGESFSNIVNVCPELLPQTVVVNGVSKAYAMTGWRIGYAAGPQDIITSMKKIQSQSTSNPNSIAQAAALEAIAGDQSCIVPMVKAFKERHDFVIDRLNGINGMQCLPCQGTFYAFPDCSGVIESTDNISSDTELATHLIEHAEVAMVPGSAFGAPGHMRLSFATGLDTLREALDRVEKALS